MSSAAAWRSVTIALRAPLLREDLPGLHRRTCVLLCGRPAPELLLCDVHGIAADGIAIDALARLALAARREGARVRLRGASPQLLGLVELTGLGGVLPVDPIVRGR